MGLKMALKEPPSSLKQIKNVSVEAIRPNPYQPRRVFEEESLQELANSIKTVGIVHPPTVRDLGDDNYELVAGERRLRAAIKAGLEEIPVFINNSTTQSSAEGALIENLQREDLNPIEVAKGMRLLIDTYHYTQEELSTRVGKKRSTVTNFLRLLAMPLPIQEAVAQNKLTMGHAKALMTVEKEAQQLKLLDMILKKSYSVRQTEKAARFLTRPSRPTPESNNIHLEYLETAIQRRLGTKVSITGSDKKGHITIDYYCLDDLDRLLEILGIGEDIS